MVGKRCSVNVDTLPHFKGHVELKKVLQSWEAYEAQVEAYEEVLNRLQDVLDLKQTHQDFVFGEVTLGRKTTLDILTRKIPSLAKDFEKLTEELAAAEANAEQAKDDLMLTMAYKYADMEKWGFYECVRVQKYEAISDRFDAAKETAQTVRLEKPLIYYGEAVGRFAKLMDVRDGRQSNLQYDYFTGTRSLAYSDSLNIQIRTNKNGKKYFTVERSEEADATDDNVTVGAFETWVQENCPSLYEDATSGDGICKMKRSQLKRLVMDARDDAFDAGVDMLRPIFKTVKEAEDNGDKKLFAVKKLNKMLTKIQSDAQKGKVQAWNNLTSDSGYLSKIADECNVPTGTDAESNTESLEWYNRFAAEDVEVDQFCDTINQIQSMFEGERLIDSFAL